MRVIPFEIYKLQTELSLNEVKTRLQANIATGNYLRRQYTAPEIYEGAIIEDYFELRMITPGRYAFRAIIGGKIFSEQTGLSSRSNSECKR